MGVCGGVPPAHYHCNSKSLHQRLQISRQPNIATVGKLATSRRCVAVRQDAEQGAQREEFQQLCAR